jgi:hypothetical protein
MSGKGSGRRPQQVDDAEAAANWARIFGKKDNTPAEPEPNDDKEPDDER